MRIYIKKRLLFATASSYQNKKSGYAGKAIIRRLTKIIMDTAIITVSIRQQMRAEVQASAAEAQWPDC